MSSVLQAPGVMARTSERRPPQLHRPATLASDSRREMEALILAVGTLFVLFALAVVATIWPAAI
jgi:hypothetical protein